MKSEIEKLRELRKEVERKMKRVSDYIDTDTFQRAKGSKKEITDRKATMLANDAKKAVDNLDTTIAKKIKQMKNELDKVKSLDYIIHNYPRFMWYYYIKEWKKEGNL